MSKFADKKKVIGAVALVVLGVLGFWGLHLAKAPPKKREGRDRGAAVRVLNVQPMEVIPQVTGYGVVQAQRTWQAVAEVGGTIVEISPDLEVGRTIQKGTLLFRIDPGSYELERNRGEASVRGVQAQIAEIKTREDSARASLQLEQRMLDLAKKDLERAQKAVEAGLGAQTDVETAERGVLAAQKSVQSLKNTLLELPASRRVLEAQIAAQQADVAGARKDIAKTSVVAPFTMRIREVHASLQQAVGSGAVVVVGDGIDVMEVAAHMPIGTIGPLMGPRTDPQDDAPASESNPPAPPRPATPDGAPEEISGDAPEPDPDPATPKPRPPSRASRITAQIWLKGQDLEMSWDGKFRRFQGVDPTTRTIGVVVDVEAPRRSGARRGPPLSSGMHVEVELKGVPRADCLAVPRDAIIDGDKVYIVGPESRLVVRQVEIDILQEDYACVAKGLEAGEQVVLTALTPAVEGMLLAPKTDEVAVTWLASVTKGHPAAN